MGNAREHKVLNVYGKTEIKTVENALEAADAEANSEAIVEICAAYTGHDFRDDFEDN